MSEVFKSSFYYSIVGRQSVRQTHVTPSLPIDPSARRRKKDRRHISILIGLLSIWRTHYLNCLAYQTHKREQVSVREKRVKASNSHPSIHLQIQEWKFRKEKKTFKGVFASSKTDLTSLRGLLAYHTYGSLKWTLKKPTAAELSCSKSELWRNLDFLYIQSGHLLLLELCVCVCVCVHVCNSLAKLWHMSPNKRREKKASFIKNLTLAAATNTTTRTSPYMESLILAG